MIDNNRKMPTKKSAAPEEIYQIHVSLVDTPIWRRLLVPAHLTLAQLHGVLQIAMGWEDCHMHDFRIGKRLFGTPDPDEGPMGMATTTDERTARLGEVLNEIGATAVYTYDFGDGWEHEITVEKKLPPELGRFYPSCTEGERQCPPEDCGGVPGFYDLLEALGDPKHEEHEDMREWLGRNFDPEAFSIDQVNRRLASSVRGRSKPKRTPGTIG